MEPKSISYRVGDGAWQELTWDRDERLYISTDKKVKVAKPQSEDGKEVKDISVTWKDTTYTVTCTPGYDPTICNIYDSSKGVSGAIRFGSTPPAIAAAAPEPTPPAAAASDSAEGLAPAARHNKLTKWASAETRIPQLRTARLVKKIDASLNEIYGIKPVSEHILKAIYEKAVAEDLSPPKREPPTPLLPAAPAPRESSPRNLTDQECREKLVDWAHAEPEERISRQGAIDVATKVYQKHGKKPISEEKLRGLYDAEIAKAAADSPKSPSSDTPLTDQERREKLVEWAHAEPEERISRRDAIDVVGEVYRKHGRKPISEEKLRAYYDAAIKAALGKSAASGAKFRAPVDVQLAAPKEKAEAPAAEPAEKPKTMKDFDRELKAAVAKSFPGKGPQFLTEVERKLRDALKDTSDPQAKIDRLPEMIQKVQKAIEEKYSAPPSAPVKSKEQIATEAKQAAAETKSIAAHRAALNVAKMAFDRIDAISKLSPELQEVVNGKELTHLNNVIESYEDTRRELIATKSPSDAIASLIRDFEAEHSRAVAQQKIIIGLVGTLAEAHIKKLRSYAEVMKSAFAAIDTQKFPTAKANFQSRFGRTEEFLKGVAGIEPQPQRLKIIQELKEEVIKLDPTRIRGSEKELRTRLNALVAVLRTPPKNLYPHTKELLAIEAKLDEVRAGLPQSIAESFDSTIKTLRDTAKDQQEVIVEVIAKHDLRTVQGFTHPIDYTWLTDNKNRPETKKNAQDAIKALQWLFGPTSTVLAKDVVWDSKLLLARGSKVDPLKERWENAHAVLRLIDDYETRGQLPAVIVRPLTPQQNAEAAADAKFKPTEAKVKAIIAAIDTIFASLFDKTKSFQPPINQGPPYIEDLPRLKAELNRLEKELDDTTIDPRITDALDAGRKKDVDALMDKRITAYSQITRMRAHLISIKGDDVRFTTTAVLLQEVDKIERGLTEASTSSISQMRYRLSQIEIVAIDRTAKNTDRLAGILLKKTRKVITSLNAPAPAGIKTASAQSAEELQSDLVRYGETLRRPDVERDEVQQVRELLKKIYETATKRIAEPGMNSVKARALRMIDLADKKILELAPAVPPAAPVSSEQPEVNQARKELAAAEAEYKTFSQELSPQSFAALVVLFQKTSDLMLNFAPNDEELTGKSADYKELARLSRAFNSRLGTFSKRVYSEIHVRMKTRMTDLNTTKAAADAAMKAKDAPALNAAKSRMKDDVSKARSDLAEYSKVVIDRDTISKMRVDIDALAMAVDKMRIESKAEPTPTRPLVADSETPVTELLDDLERQRTLLVGIGDSRDSPAEAQRVRVRVAQILATAENRISEPKMSTVAARARILLRRIDGKISELSGGTSPTPVTKPPLPVAETKPDAVKAAQAERDAAAAATREKHSEATRLQNALREMSSELNSNPNPERLAILEAKVISAIEKLKTLGDDVFVKSVLSGYISAQRTILKLREKHDATHAIASVRSRVTELIVEGKKSSDTGRDLPALRKNLDSLKRIQIQLNTILKDELPTLKGDKDSLSRALNNGIIAINGYIASLTEAIRLKEPSPATKPELKIGTSDGKPDVAKTLAAVRLDRIVSGVVHRVGGKPIDYEKARPDIGGYRIPVISVQHPSSSAAREALASKVVSGVLKQIWDSGGDPSDFRIIIASHVEMSDYKASLSIAQKHVKQADAFVASLKNEKYITLFKLDPLVIDKGSEEKAFSNVVSIFIVPNSVLKPVRSAYGEKVEQRVGGIDGEASSKSKASPAERITGQYITKLGLKSGNVTELPTVGASKSDSDDLNSGHSPSAAPVQSRPADAPPPLGKLDIKSDPIKLPPVDQHPQVRGKNMRAEFGLDSTQAGVYLGKIDPKDFDKPGKLKERLAKIMSHAKSLGMDHVCILYRGILKASRDGNYHAFEKIVRQVDPNLEYLRPRPIGGSSLRDGSMDVVHYVLVKNSSVKDSDISSKQEEYLKKAMDDSH